jgi:capsular polysaccharide transport system permease protein
MSEALKSQFNIVIALTLRQIRNQNSKMNYGYVWALVEVILSLAFLSLIKLVVRGFTPPGMPPLTFLVSGIMPWMTFLNTMTSTELIITRNKNLLRIPGVMPLDIVMANALQIFCTYGVVYIGVAIATSYFEGSGFPRFPIGIIANFIFSSILGLSLGLVLMPLIRVLPLSGSLIHPFFRLGMLFGGVFIVISVWPEYYWPYLTWNPMLHVMELDRTYWFSTYQTPVGNLSYLLKCVVGLLLLGLLIERYARTRIPP